MTRLNNRNILIISNDNTIIDGIENSFNGNNIFIYPNKNKISNNYDVIILDDFSKIDNKTRNFFLKTEKVINISNTQYQNAENINQPFFLNNLMKTINDFISNNSKIMKFKDFEIVNNILFYKNKEIVFGNKEIDLIKYLYYNGELEKDKILNYIWGYNEDIETKVLENTSNKIKQKTKIIGIPDLIILENKKYKINSNYLNN